jgi:integrase/recombinase XerD
MQVLHLFDEQGQRLFFNLEERAAFLKAADKAAGTTRTFCYLLHYTGCTLTEAVAVTPAQIDFSGRAVVLQGTTERRQEIARTVPVPDAFLALFDEMHDIRQAQSGPHANERIWPQDIKSLRDRVGRVIKEAGIRGGPHALPRAIRYGFLVHAIRCGIILTRAERWMGYCRSHYLGQYVEQLALYQPDLIGDEREDASLMW